MHIKSAVNSYVVDFLSKESKFFYNWGKVGKENRSEKLFNYGKQRQAQKSL